MKLVSGLLLATGALALAAFVLGVPDWHRPVHGEQIGADGSGTVQFDSESPWKVMDPPKAAEPPSLSDGPAAATQFKNVSVMTDVSADEFMRSHRAITAWVSAKQGCGLCHTGTDYAADDNPMKAETREMIRLTRYINTRWRGHVGEDGVTCFSCHRGEPVPPGTWISHPSRPARLFFEADENWDENASTVRGFFPDNGFALYLLHSEPIHVESRTAMAGNDVAPEVSAKRVYEFMMQMADDIGVNCGYCHDSRNFQDWSHSPHSRWIAYDAIRMTRDLNVQFLVGLNNKQPQTQQLEAQNALVAMPGGRGPTPANGFIVCATCHYGKPVPDEGAATVSNYPAFGSKMNASPGNPSSPAFPAAGTGAPP